MRPSVFAALVLLAALCLPTIKAINVAYFYDGVLIDAGFNQLTYQGLQKVVEGFPQTNLTLLYVDSDTLLSLGSAFPFPAGFDKTDVVVAAGFQFADPISGWSSTHPNMKFVLIDVALASSPANVNSAIFAEDQLGFIIGSVAGRVSKTGWVGALSGLEIGPVSRYSNGYQQGVYSTCPSCKVIISYIGSFTDGVRGADLAAFQKTLGVDVMVSFSGYPGVAGILTVANDTYMIGVDGDLYLTAFNNGTVPGAKNVLFSTAKGVDTAAYVSTLSVIQNAFRSGTSLFQFSNGGVRILPCYESCAFFNPKTDPATLALEDSFNAGGVATLVSPDGPLAYLSTLRTNEWTSLEPNYSPASAVSVVGAHINDGFSDKVFFLLGSITEAWLWWPTHRMWLKLSTPPPLTGAAIASNDATSVYVFGGRDNLLPTSELYRYDFSTAGDSWTVLNSSSVEVPDARGGASMAYNSIDGFFYMFGGSAFNFFNDVWRLNATSVEWTKLSTTGDVPLEREFATMVCYDDTLIVYGGGDTRNNILSDVIQLNLTTLVWRKLPLNLPPRKFHTMSLTINDTLIIIGGIDDLKVRSSSVFGVNLQTDQVDQLASFPQPVQLHGAASYGSFIWVYGGSLTNGTRLNDTLVFNFSEQQLLATRKHDKHLGLKLGLGIGLSLFVVVVVLGVIAALLMKKYHLIVISKDNISNDEWT